jgi:hypothetical protein
MTDHPDKIIRIPWNAVDIHYQYKIPSEQSTELQFVEPQQFNRRIPDDLIPYMEEAPQKDWKPICHCAKCDTVIIDERTKHPCVDCPYRGKPKEP